MKTSVAALAAKGVFIGASSWKYEGWMNLLYSPTRYEYRGKVAKTRFERDCLAEYAEVFKTVSVDAAYYTFPSEKYLRGLADQVPDDFRFGFKVTDAVTIKKFPNLARFGAKAGQPNPDYLNAELFAEAFLKPCEQIREKVGVLMFEFSRFWPSDYEHGRDFVSDLDKFLGKLPKGWPYAIEMRNKHWLAPEYFGCLAKHGVTHIFNSWDAMPPISEQMALSGGRTNPNLRIPMNLDTHSDPNWTLFRDSWTVVGAKRRSGLRVNRVSNLGQGFYGFNHWDSEPQATSLSCFQGEPTGPSPNGVAPTGAGLPNSSSRLRSCAWAPFGGGPVGGRTWRNIRLITNPKAFSRPV